MKRSQEKIMQVQSNLNLKKKNYMTMFFLTWRERFSCSLYCSMIRTLTSKKDSAKTVTGCLVSLYTCIYSHFSILRWYEAPVYLNVDKKNNNNQNTFASLEFSIFEIFNTPPPSPKKKFWKFENLWLTDSWLTVCILN